MSQAAVARLAELIKGATDAQITENGRRAGQIAASASLFIDTDLAGLKTQKETELSEKVAEVSSSVAGELEDFEVAVSESIALVIENPTEAVDSLKEIKAELESDKADLERIEVSASSELAASRSAFLDEFGEPAEFVLSFDAVYAPSDVNVPEDLNNL